MRNIPIIPILSFFTLIFLSGLLSYVLSFSSNSLLIGVIYFLVINMCVYHMIAHTYPARSTEYTSNDKLFSYDLHTLYNIFFVEILLHAHIIPYPLTRLAHICVGMRLGKNSYPSSAYLCAPFHFISVGDNVIFGGNSMISPHTYESGGRVVLKPIYIGNNVTIGMNATILHGVTIEDNAIVAAGAVVTKNTHIGVGEVWAGVPARKIR